MIRFIDGPASGQILNLMRCPLLLRVTRDAAGNFDALDQLDDEPRLDESIFVYRLAEGPTRVHFLLGNPRRCEWRLKAAYKLESVQPPDGVMRDCDAWRRWANDRAKFILHTLADATS